MSQSVNTNLVRDYSYRVAAAQDEYRRFRNALKRALKRDANALGRIADKLVELALAGTPWAVREVAERLDGKAIQAINVEGSKGSYVLVIPQLPASAEQWQQDAIDSTATVTSTPLTHELPSAAQPCALPVDKNLPVSKVS